MAVEGTSRTRRDQPATAGVPHPALTRAMRLALWLLAISVFAQAILAGLFLDGNDAWREWHAANGMVLLPLLALVQVVLAILVWRPGRGPGWPAIAGVGLLLAILLQIAMGEAGLPAVHVPLGVAIFGLVGTLLGRTRDLTRPATHPTSSISSQEAA
jgi:cytochrome bd-type quinol oxidase subunit 2